MQRLTGPRHDSQEPNMTGGRTLIRAFNPIITSLPDIDSTKARALLRV